MENSVSTIFIVDDDELYLSAIEKSLSKINNLQIKKYIVGEVCLQDLKLHPDVIILDHNLDGKFHDAITGLELLKKIKSIQPEIEIIMLSGQDDLEVAVATLQNGATDYIVKNKSAFIRLNYAISKIINGLNEKKELKHFKRMSAVFRTLLIMIALLVMIYCIYNLVLSFKQ